MWGRPKAEGENRVLCDVMSRSVQDTRRPEIKWQAHEWQAFMGPVAIARARLPAEVGGNPAATIRGAEGGLVGGWGGDAHAEV